MKIAVFSDSHGAYNGMARAVEEYCPDQIIHLGDGYAEAVRLSEQFPAIPVCAVPGNCDRDCTEPDYKVIQIDSVKAFVTHGHRYAVRGGRLDTLLYAAECSGAQLAMFGHTHRSGFDMIQGVFVINPGTAGMGSDKTWARLEIGPEGKIACEIAAIPKA